MKKCANLDNPDTKWDVIMPKGWGKRKRGGGQESPVPAPPVATKATASWVCDDRNGVMPSPVHRKVPWS